MHSTITIDSTHQADIRMLQDILESKKLKAATIHPNALQVDIKKPNEYEILTECLAVFCFYKIINRMKQRQQGTRMELTKVPKEILESNISLISMYLYLYFRENQTIHVGAFLEFNLYPVRKTCDEMVEEIFGVES